MAEGRMLSPGGWAVSRVRGQPLGQLKVSPSVLLLRGSKLEVKWGNAPRSETVHLLLTALL